ncbi:murein DD-endopeptidase MepM/ murein hydrolase activator NlpD [Leucobacter luti]|uniref:M23 family metallopeptidase n=1 Tax=Leucobacter luti TaxID=340320 RepID=UPI0010DFD22E|nr:M23 family metallopeptidase [Leucobacter luti]MCW2287726.1 murein DD-endopeptidase MepM/ murein hydrolase activator NlpD [Leucobacter luti]TCK46109.1 murein DD-endopeptidase MepM/ murein hydrolase activator NlpD [Leucobacter luti]
MPETLPAKRTKLPSRKSLRATAPRSASATTSPTATSTMMPVSAGAAALAPGISAGEYVRVPVLEHVPATAPERAAAHEQPKRSLRRRIAGAAAVACVGGLVLTAAVPLVQSSTEMETAAAQQGLFSEVSAAEVPASLSDITAVAVDEVVEGNFTFRANALVNYPFAQSVLLTDPFGYRTAPVAQFHDAQDFGAAAGTPIQAIADGTVLEAGFASDGCGFGLKLEHDIDGKEVTSRYCHMQDASHSYKVGDVLKMGDLVGKVGATGMAFGAHLHMAVRVDDEPVDPMPFLAKYSRIDRDAQKVTTRGETSPAPTVGTPVPGER